MPPDAEWRSRALASLPRDGEMTPSATERAKLEAAGRFVDYTAHRRVDFKVIDVGQAFVGVYFRTVVLVSVQALAILDEDDVIALVAHELGHDAHAAEYREAIARRDDRRMKELELDADGFGVLALIRAGIDPERLVAAIRKVMRYNDRRLEGGVGHGPEGAGATDGRYVPVGERIAFIRAVAAVRWESEPPAAHALHALGRAAVSAPRP
jgi:hypothetical protein